MHTQTSDQTTVRQSEKPVRIVEASKPAGKRVPPQDEAVEADGDAPSVDAHEADASTGKAADGQTFSDASESSSDGAAAQQAAGAEATGPQDEPSCRQIRSDGTEEDCDHSAVWPWMIAGSGILLAGAAGAVGHGSDSHATAAAPAPSPPGAPNPPPAPPPPVLPTAPRLITSSGKDTIDGTGHVDVALAAPGSSWVYRLDGDDTWHAGQGGSLDAGTLGRGVHAVMVAQLDGEGRRGDVATLAVRVHDDVPAPGLALVHDNGSSSTDGLTNDGTVAVSGLAADAIFFYRVNGATEWIEGAAGQVPAGALVAGQNRIEAYQVDASGEYSPLNSLTLTLDLTPPEAPQLQTSNGTDLLNAHDFINVSGIEGGADWRFRVNGQGDWIEGHDGRIPAGALAGGENHVEVVQVDAAGNVGAAATLTVRQDLEAPDPLRAHVDGGRGDLVSLQGSIAIDNIEDGATWKYRINGESEWHVGSGTQLSANILLEGRNDVTLVQTDSSGHDSAATSITVTRDSLAPDRPDLVTSNGLPMINAQGSLLVHRLEDAATWEYRIDGGDWITGTGSSLAASSLHEGAQTVDVRQTDAVGHVSEVDSISITLDSTAPGAVLLSVLKSNGAAAPDSLINATGYVSIGNIEAEGRWEFKANGDDHWRPGGGTQLASRFLDEGVNTVSLRQVDSAGNVGEASSVTLTLDTTPPAISVTRNDLAGEYVDGAYMQLNSQDSFRVKFQDNEKGQVSMAGRQYGFGPNEGASWGAGLFNEGANTLQVTASDKAGNTSSRTITVYVDTEAPAALDVGLKNDTGSNHSDRITSDGTVVLSGMQEAVNIGYSLDNGQHWSNWQTNTEIPGSVFGSDGVKNLLVRVSDFAGNMGPTTSFQFTLDSSVI
ncbi:Ig-like domain-containing protein [Mitsuaria sp. CC2]|uniref:hypothetical protein n=1 Tax=Mitsuaria sp. CC2 TaxID=3029186 RepID=UPI003B8C372F